MLNYSIILHVSSILQWYPAYRSCSDYCLLFYSFPVIQSPLPSHIEEYLLCPVSRGPTPLGASKTSEHQYCLCCGWRTQPLKSSWEEVGHHAEWLTVQEKYEYDVLSVEDSVQKKLGGNDWIMSRIGRANNEYHWVLNCVKGHLECGWG